MLTPEFAVPAALDATDWSALEPLIRALLARPISTRDELERWILDRSELDAAISEAQATLYINMTCDTESQPAQAAYAAFVERVHPKLKPLAFELDLKQHERSAALQLTGTPRGDHRYHVLARDTAVEVELFREDNVPIQTELALLAQKYEQLIGAMAVTFDGHERTLPQMARYAESTDRAVRERAWRAVAERRLRDADTLDTLFDQMLASRDRMARNVGFASYIGYAFTSMHRFDYGPAECDAFHRACAQHVVPLVRKLDRQRAAALGLERLRPWDLAVDVKARPPLRPFESGRQLIAKSRAAFDRLDPRLGTMLRALGDGSNSSGARHPDGSPASLDLDTRKGKAPGGYQYMRDRSRKPFIFMNAAGLQSDVSTMLHEAGHAFHSMLCTDEPLLAYRGAPTEICEVASMSMELLTMPHWGGPDGFYQSPDDLARARRQQIERSIVILPWIATIDKFQHWLYANPAHGRDARTQRWLALDAEFGHEVDWHGLEEPHAKLWHRQPHLFNHPLYYIEYGIAQLGALQLWLTSLEKGPEHAIERYLAALRLGGSRPLPELFHAAGLPFDFGPSTVQRLTERAEHELEKLPI